MHWSEKEYQKAKDAGFKFCVRSYTPSFVSGVEPNIVWVNDLDDMYKLSFVKRWVSDDLDRLEVLEKKGSWDATEETLMAHMKDGKFFVVCFFQDLAKI